MDACLLRKIRAFIEAQVGMVAMGLAPSLCVFFGANTEKRGVNPMESHKKTHQNHRFPILKQIQKQSTFG